MSRSAIGGGEIGGFRSVGHAALPLWRCSDTAAAG
jgi:hypothetical protein